MTFAAAVAVLLASWAFGFFVGYQVFMIRSAADAV